MKKIFKRLFISVDEGIVDFYEDLTCPTLIIHNVMLLIVIILFQNFIITYTDKTVTKAFMILSPFTIYMILHNVFGLYVSVRRKENSKNSHKQIVKAVYFLGLSILLYKDVVAWAVFFIFISLGLFVLAIKKNNAL